MPPDIVMGGGDVESEYPEDLPAPGASVMYTPVSYTHLIAGWSG